MAAPISIRGVSRRFGETWALKTVDLEIAAGEFVALVGPSGCGKTTLLRIVADLVEPSTGEVRIGSDRAAEVRREFGLEGHEGKRARQLSGGMLQRVNIASAMAHDPSVLLMDEPFAALDEMKREEIGEWFDRELTVRPKTVLFVTHHIDEAVMLADRLLVFSPAPGRVLEVVSVPVPRPRDASFRQDPRFVAIAAHVRGLLMHKEAA